MRKNKRSSVALVKKSSIVATEIALAFMSVQFAYAQQQAAAERVERVEITGTRLPVISTEGASPVAVMNAEEIRMDGLAKPEDLLRNLPQVFDSQSTTQSNGATGTAQVNLRNLGPDRNLVLVNGKRLPPGSPRQGGYAADLNQIPTPLIQRVELLTGGASAIYGSDAISGVVNFILNDRFEGVQVDYYHSFAQHEQHDDRIQSIVAARQAGNPSQFQVPGDVDADGRINGLSLMIGKNFADNKGNATAFFHYKKESAVKQANRDFSACALGTTAGGTRFNCAGSGTSFPGAFFLPGTDGIADGPVLTVADAAGTTRPFLATDQFNFGPYNYFRRPSSQYGANAFVHFDAHPQVRLYSELGFHDNRTNAVIAPSGIFIGPVFNINFENPLLSADWRAQLAAANAACGAPCGPFAAPGDTSPLLIGRRNIEGGGRDDDIRHTSTRAVFGAKGDVAKHWNYDVFAQLGNVYYQSVYRNEFSTDRTRKALDVIANPAAAAGGTTRVPVGTPVCRSEIDGTDANCRPYNLWSLGGVTQEALNYIEVNGVRNGDTRQDVVGLSLRSDLGNYGLKLPSAKNGLGFVVGVERRRESLRSEPDSLFQINDLAGQGGATIPVQGELGVREIFTELGIPIMEGRPFADLLSVNLSYRYSDYTTDKTTNTYGIGAEWAPVKSVKTRASYAHAVRHANITELFLGQGTNLFDMAADPCGPTATGGPPTATAAQCALTGLSAAQYGNAILFSPAGQYQFLQGGVPTLNPEKADTYTLGIVLQPARDFTTTIDYWNIKIDDAIDAPTPSSLLTGCLNTGSNCNLIQRDPATGALWFGNGRVVALNANIGGYKADGIDLAMNYMLRMGGLGGLGFNFAGSWLNKWEFEPIKGAGRFDCVGFYGANCSFNRGPLPEWRHKFRVSWNMPWNVDVAATWRHIHKVHHETMSSDPDIAGSVANVDKVLGHRDYLDLAFAWNITKVFSLRGGINNVLDRDPPIVSNGVAGPSVLGNGNTFPGTYDALGRVFFFNLGMKL